MISTSNSTSASPSPKSPEVSEKSKKYDRQLRLWGDHGQSKLESSRVCLINANATGTEILKSLVLPGCGTFTIIDNTIVTQADIGINFFLDADSLGKNRGECAKQLLLDLNPDVNGECINDSPENILRQESRYFNVFSVVIASQLAEKDIISLSKNLWENKIPFIYCQCVGLIGWIRVQLNEHKIIESHPENVKFDLRLDAPFPELTKHIDEISVAHNNRGEVLKMPWLVLLFKAIQTYMGTAQQNENQGQQVQNGGNQAMETDVPIHPCHLQGTARRQFINESLRGWLRLTEGDEIFEETINAANKALTRTIVPENTLEILGDPKTQNPEGSSFWVMCNALEQFVQENGTLPLSGTLPDMTAESQKYIALQTVYREKALKDMEDILQKCEAIAKQNSTVKLKPDEVRLFCKESHNLKLLRGTAFFAELESSPANILNELAQNMEDLDEEKVFYIMLRGALRFQAIHNTFPGASQDHEPDITEFKSLMLTLSNEWNTPSQIIKDDYIQEMCRFGASEIPSIAGFIGGCVAQEVIKIVTSQYVPLNNTLIYNAINSTTTSFAM